ncbi:hypothetical protein [Roseococcus sp.]|uniref:hypothetical protein n=1 Tax=Roseococcus sp. TaxID=2109646 RepID=UPI003BAA56EE
MRRHLTWAVLLMSGFGLQAAQAQQSPNARLPAAPSFAGGQDLSSSNYERPRRLHAPTPLEADRARRAERQAQYRQNFPGTALPRALAFATPPRRPPQ